MKQVSYVISTYTSDISGVCSALYELGGMVVIHDPSGCNSTYNTHDEPRWFSQDSLIFISGLSQMDAVMGRDEKLVEDVIRAATELHPRFIVLVRSPIPLMIGTDFEGICREIESVTGIPTYFIPTTGMKSYVKGVGMALELVVEKMMKEGSKQLLCPQAKKRVNVLGATPLDFSINDTYSSLLHFLKEHDCFLQGSLALQTDYEELKNMPQADVNLVVTSSGYPAALAMEEEYGIPYVVGFPCGCLGEEIEKALEEAKDSQKNTILYRNRDLDRKEKWKSNPFPQGKGILVYEPVLAQCLALDLSIRYDRRILPATMLETDADLVGPDLILVASEEEMAEVFQHADFVIADPMFQPICPKGLSFYPLPQEAFSGRIYRKQIPDLMRLGW